MSFKPSSLHLLIGQYHSRMCLGKYHSLQTFGQIILLSVSGHHGSLDWKRQDYQIPLAAFCTSCISLFAWKS
jgi:hypothetical protein